MSEPVYRDEQWLAERVPEMTQREIAEEAGCAQPTIARWERIHGLERQHPILDDPDVLRCLYEDERMSVSEIAERAGCSYPTARARMHKYDIEVRQQEDVDERLNDQEWLRERYESGDSLRDIAAEVDCSRTTVWRRLVSAGVELRGTEGAVDSPDSA